jgi:hypothetical protein
MTSCERDSARGAATRTLRAQPPSRLVFGQSAAAHKQREIVVTERQRETQPVADRQSEHALNGAAPEVISDGSHDASIAAA